MKNLIGTVVLGIIINRAFYGFSCLQKLQMLYQKLGLQGIGMIVIDSYPLFKGNSILLR